MSIWEVRALWQKLICFILLQYKVTFSVRVNSGAQGRLAAPCGSVTATWALWPCCVTGRAGHMSAASPLTPPGQHAASAALCSLVLPTNTLAVPGERGSLRAAGTATGPWGSGHVLCWWAAVGRGCLTLYLSVRTQSLRESWEHLPCCVAAWRRRLVHRQSPG